MRQMNKIVVSLLMRVKRGIQHLEMREHSRHLPMRKTQLHRQGNVQRNYRNFFPLDTNKNT